MEIAEWRWVLRPFLSEIACRCGEAVGFGRIRHRRGGALEECASPPDAGHRAPVGKDLPVYASALGKALLAFGWADSRGLGIGCPRLVPHTHKTIRTREGLFRELEVIRHRGFALEDEELRVGVRAVCVPVWGDADNPLGGLVIEGQSGRLTDDRLRAELIPLALDAGDQLGRILRSQPDPGASRLPDAGWLPPEAHQGLAGPP